MSNENEISFIGDLYETVNGYSKKIGDFANNMEEGTNAISSGLKDLSKFWKQDSYDTFAKRIGEKIANIQTELNRARELEKELAETAIELREALDILKSAGDN